MKKKLIIIVAGVILLLAAGGGYYWITRDKGTSNNTNTSSDNSSQEATQSSSKMVEDACSVFTVAEISNAFKVTVEADPTKDSNKVVQDDGTSKQTCHFVQSELEAGGAQKAYAFSLDVENQLNTNMATKAHEDMNVNVGNQSYEVVPGIGLAASFKRNKSLDKSSTQLEWVAGQTIYRFTAVNLTGVMTSDEDLKIKSLVNTKF